MKHIIVFCYIFTVLMGVTALTIQWLAGKGDKRKDYSEMRPFVAMLMLMNLYDFFIYYNDNIIDSSSGNILLSGGDCLIAILVLLWLRVENRMSGDGKINWAENLAKKYVPVYIIIWIGAIILFFDVMWIRLVIDVPLLILLFAGSTHSVINDFGYGGDKQKVSIYKAVITVFMMVNYITYFVSESGIVEESTENLMDLTIFYWLVINTANIILLYKRDFSRSYLEESIQELNLEAALKEVQAKYDLTKRETEILKEIYQGKTNTQIGSDLYISESTVKAHIYNLFRKLNVKNRMEAVCIVRDEKER